MYNAAIHSVTDAHMPRVLLLTGLFFWSLASLASPKGSLYQVDMIVFTHQPTAPREEAIAPVLPTYIQDAITLLPTASAAMTPYHTLPSASSSLQNEYFALHRNKAYEILGHYTWLQPENSRQPVLLPQMVGANWNVEGALRIRQSNYYLLDADLLFSVFGQKKPAFAFTQKQRLKAGVVYYLDHPEAGMLIKIHKVA